MLRTCTLAILLLALLTSRSSLGQFVEEADAEAIEAKSTSELDSSALNASDVAQLIVEKTNEFRAAHNRSKLEVSPKLVETAQYFARYMAKNDQYGHHADGLTPSQRATKFGYNYCLISENIAYQYDSTGFAAAELAKRFVDGWETSPGHRKNMLDEDVVETGVAVAQSNETGYWYAVQMFGRPRSAAIEFKIANSADTIIDYTIKGQTFKLPPRYTRTHIRCRPTDVNFGFRPKSIEPPNGSRYSIVEVAGKLELQKEGETSSQIRD
jgi:uncharacterized protein YkwD